MGKFPYESIQRKILVRKEAIIAQAPECSVAELLQYGLVNLDKPRGPTSHQAAEWVKKVVGASKAGHSGTLDPIVTGVLVVALGRATRIAEALLRAGKEYVAVMYLHREISEEKIKRAFERFTGTISQLPPVKSSVRRIERERNVYYVEILEIEGQHVLFKIGCQAGTYIRKYIHDLGQYLGCGAHMAELRRTRVAAFDESSLVTLQDLSDAFWYYKHEANEKMLRKFLQPIENAIRHLPKIWAFDGCMLPLSHGRDLAVPGIIRVESAICPGDIVAILSRYNTLISIGTSRMSSEEMIQNQKGIAVKNDKVFIGEM